MEMEWDKLTFNYTYTPYRFVCQYKDGAWEEGSLSTDDKIVLSESANILQYCQQVFEGLKAYRTVSGDVVLFRPDMNAARLAYSARRMHIPVFPEERFLEAVKAVVKANMDYVPPYGKGSLYLRPFIFGKNAVLGVKSATEFEFRVFASPVGPYFKGGVRKPLRLRVPDYDRAAPKGTGGIKAGLNYAMSIFAIEEAHELGYDENLYLDAAHRIFVEETGGANIIFFTKEGKLVTPKSDSILPSITKQSLIYVVQHYLHRDVEERRICIDEFGEFNEAGLIGTAAVISPLGSVDFEGKTLTVAHGMEEEGPMTKKLYETLCNIQNGIIEAPDGWLVKIE